MKAAVVLSLMLSCCYSEASVNDSNYTIEHGSDSNTGKYSCNFMAYKLGVLEEKIANMETKAQESKNEILELRGLTAGPKVAFSAALRASGSGNIGPFSVDTPLKYQRVFSNTGNCYNPSTGIFTAAVKGMYFFRFSMFNSLNPPNSVVSLMKNYEHLGSVYDTSGSDIHDMGSNAAVINLDVGDTVFVKLWSNSLVYDDGMNYNTFSGFLLFTL